MRFYSFTNALYMSPLQLGLQTAHCVAEMSQNEKFENVEMFNEWANYHKTIIIYDGGNHRALEEIFDFINTPNNPFPIAMFREDEESLNNAVTSVGIVLPEEVYESARFLRNKNFITRLQHVDGITCEFVTISSDIGAMDNLKPEEVDMLYKCSAYLTKFNNPWIIELMKLMNSCRLA
jgi:hypothetical protein